MIRAQSLVNNEPVDWRSVLRSVWIDVELPSEQELAALGERLRFNRLALDDALTEGQWSRFEAYPEHLFLVFRTLREPQACNDETERVSLFWYPSTDTLLTLRRQKLDYLERIWTEFEPIEHGREEQLIYALLSQGANTFFEFTDSLRERTDALEEEMFTSPRAQLMASQVFFYKHLIMNVRRLASNARDAVATFARHTLIATNGGSGAAHNPSEQELSVYLRDVGDTLGRVYDTLDSAREVLSNILDVNLSVQSHRMNEVMKTLTILSAIFLPLTFLAGIWGMNFQFMPELHWRYGYALAWAVMIVVAVGQVLYFRKRGWW